VGEAWELLEHTADVGIRARGDDATRLFENAAAAMLAIAFNPASVAEREQREFSADGGDREMLLANFLDEVLWLIDGEGWLPHRVSVKEISEARVRAEAFGERRDASRHEMRTIIKAVTLHQLAVRQRPGAWEAEVYFDI
jgi:SHS2 domain-containing protein